MIPQTKTCFPDFTNFQHLQVGGHPIKFKINQFADFINGAVTTLATVITILSRCVLQTSNDSQSIPLYYAVSVFTTPLATKTTAVT